MEYSHTTVDFASWPDKPMFSHSEPEYITTTVHLENQDLLREVNVEVTVG